MRFALKLKDNLLKQSNLHFWKSPLKARPSLSEILSERKVIELYVGRTHAVQHEFYTKHK